MAFGIEYPAWAHFEPRPDQPERWDQQQSFVEERVPGVSFLIGGNGAGTSTAAMCKICRFLLSQQEAPRYDTPFWILGPSYDLICEVAWKEKLHGMQFIPDDEVDWGRITWGNSNKGHPLSVPLKPWLNGDPSRNWVIEFKSYSQGRKQLQGASIGGFCFSEQFSYDLLKEVIGRCREYSFPGRMMAEFTPVDPTLSVKIQEMQENGTLADGQKPIKGRLYMPKGWKVYRANTEVAMEQGHVDAEWFESFFGSMDEGERSVRMIGAYATFESQIYPTFNPAIHNIPSEEVYPNNGDFPIGVYHYRAIDWGFSAEHAFVCLWGYKYPDNDEWVIYDEYFSTDQRVTVVEHLGRISSRWDWPDDNPHYKHTYADPSRQDHIRIAHRLNSYPQPDGTIAKPINMQNAANSVYEGIDHVRSTLHPNTQGRSKLRICREFCPNLWRQMQTYRWVRGTDSGLNPRAGKPEPLKVDDDAVDALRYLLFTEARKSNTTTQQLVHKESAARRTVQLYGGMAALQ